MADTHLMSILSGDRPPKKTYPLIDVKLLPKDVTEVYPLTTSQHGIWSEYMTDYLSTKYNLTVVWTYEITSDKSDISVQAARRAIQILTERHPVLRTKIVLLDSKIQLAVYNSDRAQPQIDHLQNVAQLKDLDNVSLQLRKHFDLQSEFPVRWLIETTGSGCRIFLVGHHLCVDGTSMSIISGQFAQIYKISAQGGSDIIDPVIYRSFAEAHQVEREWEKTEDFQNASNFWLSQIRGTREIKWELPKSLKTEPTSLQREITPWMRFSKKDLASLSAAFSTSWFRVCVTAVGMLVHKYSKTRFDEDINLGLSFAARPEGFADTLGQFAMAPPVKVPIYECLSGSGKHIKVKDIVTAVSGNIKSAKMFERFSISHMAAMAREKGTQFQLPRVAISSSPQLQDTRSYLIPVEGTWDLFFVFQNEADGVNLGVIHDPTIFSADDIASMRLTFQSLVKDMTESPDIDAQSLLGTPKYMSYPPVPQKVEMTPEYWFQQQADSCPEKIALSNGETGDIMTYGDLIESSRKAANFILSKNLELEDIVILHLPRGFQYVVWMIASLISGVVFVYLDPGAPAARKRAIIEQVSCRLIISESELNLGENTQHTELPEVISPTHLLSMEFGPSLSHPQSHNLAYIIFTSGSTGIPKGVMIERGNLTAFIIAASAFFKIGHESRMLNFATFAFDASIIEIMLTLSAGATLCMAEHPRALVGSYLEDVIETNKITAMQITPTILATLPADKAYPSLQFISLGGEAVSTSLIQTWLPKVRVLNAYGPTETAIAVAIKYYERGGTELAEDTVGEAIGENKIWICDTEFTKLLPQGETGEICISGPQVGRGYINQLKGTEANFRVHPQNGIRMYRTGDQGKLHSDNSVVITGRIDRQLKIRGLRVSPEEIEAMILSCSCGVINVSVLAGVDEMSIVACISPLSVDIQILKEKLKQKLPDYMVPSKYLSYETLPLNSSEKINHSLIREMAKEALVDAKPQLPKLYTNRDTTIPKHDIRQGSKQSYEAQLQLIWQDILLLDQKLPVSTNFFDIGGNSILVAQLHERVKCQFPGSDVKLIDLFHKSTISQQAVLLEEKEGQTVTRIDSMGGEETNGTRKQESEGPQANGYSSPNGERHTFEDHEEKSNQKPNGYGQNGIHETTSPSQNFNHLHSLQSKKWQGVAIVGIAGKLPGANDPSEFFEKLQAGYDGVSTSTKKSPPLEYPDTIWVNRAGVLDNVEDFDHEMFSLTKDEATDMDPQHRLFLESAIQAFDDADIILSKNSRNEVGVFVGAAPNTYHSFTEATYGDGFFKASRGVVAPSISARVAYNLNLHGPNITTNVNCASGLASLSLAADSLKCGRCDTALVGGVSVQLYNGGYMTNQGQIFSVKGECRPFDSQSDGTIPSDGVIAMVAMRTEDAIRDGHPIYAIIAGSAIGSDGSTEKAGYQVPSPRGQAEVIKRAWKEANLDVNRLRYLEIHGSGTPVGDALEIEGLRIAFEELGYDGDEIIVGSTKGNIGNTQHASGLASLMKLCMSLQGGIIPPTRNFASQNPLIDLADMFQLADSSTKLRIDSVLGVSNPGWGGINCHVVVVPPPAQFLKRSFGSKLRFHRSRLQAPRHENNSKPDGKHQDETKNHIQYVVCQCASEILQQPVESNTDLRNSGLTSHAYVQLIAKVSEALGGTRIGIAGLTLRECTPRALAELHITRMRHKPAKVNLATIEKSRSDGPTFVLIPPAAGTCASFCDLVQILPGTIITLEYPKLENHSAVSIKRLATKFLSSLQSLERPVTEVTFIGASIGGVVALEMLNQGRANRLPIGGSLILLDSPPITSEYKQKYVEKKRQQYLKRDLSMFLDALDTYHPDFATLTVNATYISALGGDSKNYNSWLEVIPDLKLVEVEGFHEDVWQGKNCRAIVAAIHD